jgi:hypothetical protein
VAKSRQSLALPPPWDAQGYMGIIGATHGLGDESSETYSAIASDRAPDYCGTQEPLQIIGFRGFRPAEGPCGPLPPATTRPRSSGGGAKHQCDTRRRSGAGTVGDREEGKNRKSRQAFSGRPAQILLGLVPEAPNRPVSPQLGGAGLFRRLNELSVCQSRVQRDTGPRTPLHASEGRPRARYDEKESNRCSQVEYDSC